MGKAVSNAPIENATRDGGYRFERTAPPSNNLAHCQCFAMNDKAGDGGGYGCFVMVGVEPNTERGIIRQRWHLSISHHKRYPTWDEIKAARYELLPHSITVAMILPPPSEYVNLHQNCFHLHEIDGE